jgi:hypothetical protein
MRNKIIVTVLAMGGAAILLFSLLFGDNQDRASFGCFSSIINEVSVVFEDTEFTWMILLYFLIFSTIPWLADSPFSFWRFSASHFWLLSQLLIALSICFCRVEISDRIIALSGGALLGRYAFFWTDVVKRKYFRPFVILLLIAFLILASLWNIDSTNYGYLGQARLSGPWGNPNMFGLLMGTGIALTLGAAFSFQFSVFSQLRTIWKMFFSLLYLIAIIIMGRGLLHSYSRGAWLAMFCSMAYLVHAILQNKESKVRFYSHLFCRFRSKVNWLPDGFLLFFAAVLCFWHFQQTDWHPVRRIFSIINTTDFSWRNRIIAWETALQITAEHPWFGTGGNQPELLYEHYYLPPKLTESAAIQMNDYLLIGAATGIPVLFCFGMYVWLSLIKNSEARIQGPESATSDFGLWTLEWSRTTCRAGAIVLLVGFWFDGGLFKLATASTFWILLELGNADCVQQKRAEETKMHPIAA